MGLFVGAILMLIVALIGLWWLLYSRKQIKAGNNENKGYGDYDHRFGVLGGALIFSFLLVGALLAAFFSTFTVVPTRTEAVVTTFGRPDGQLGNGAHFLLPWQVTHNMDAAVQPEQFIQGPGSNDANTRCVDTRLGNQSIGCTEIRFNWQIQPDDASRLYQTYHNFDHLRNTLVIAAMRTAVNEAFADYNPIALLANNQNYTDVLPAKATLIQQKMISEIGDRVKVTNVSVPLVNFDRATQDNINAFQAQVGKTRVADQAVLTAQQQAKANEILSKSLQQSDSINVLISKCLDLVAEGKTVPGTCLPLTNGGNALVNTGAGAK